MREIFSEDALCAYSKVLSDFGSVGERHNHNFELQDLFLRIPHSHLITAELKSFLDNLFDSEPTKLSKGLKKAERAYVRTGDRITKPSYVSRVRSFSDYSNRTGLISEIDQIRSVARGFCKEPNASYHVISIFRPVDLIEKFRPGYVPCIICADFKYRKGYLTAKFIFRSCDAYNLLPFDLFYTISLAEQLLDQIRTNGFSGNIQLGDMVYWFSRIFVSRFDIPLRTSMLSHIEQHKDRHRLNRKRRQNILRDLSRGRKPLQNAEPS